MATSTVPATIKGLHRLLSEANYPLRQPSVSLGLPRQPEREMVIIGNVAGEQDYVALGTQRRDEDYTVDLYVSVLWPGYTALEAMGRAWELFAVIESVVRSNLDAGGPGVLWNELKRPLGDVTSEDEGYAYQVTSALRVRARI